MYKQDTIQELKRQIFHYTKIEVRKQTLVANRQILQDHKTLANYEVYDGDVVNLIVGSEGNLLTYFMLFLIFAFVIYEIIRFFYKVFV